MESKKLLEFLLESPYYVKKNMGENLVTNLASDLKRVELEGTGVSPEALAGAYCRIGKVRINRNCPISSLVSEEWLAEKYDRDLNRVDAASWEPVLDVVENIGDILPGVIPLQNVIKARRRFRRLLGEIKRNKRYILRGRQPFESGSCYYVIFKKEGSRHQDRKYTAGLVGFFIDDAVTFDSPEGRESELRPVDPGRYCGRFVSRRLLLDIEDTDTYSRAGSDPFIPVAEFTEKSFERMLDIPVRKLKPFFDSIIKKGGFSAE